MSDISWLDQPEVHDYAAALNYLSLHFEPNRATRIVEELRAVPVTNFKAKDVLRASQLKELDSENRHVSHDLKKMKEGESLSPILLVRGFPLVIADGYHRVCAVYLQDEDADIPCKIASLQA